MFTILPVPPTMELDERTRRGIILAFPWAGLVCGLLAGAVALLVLVCEAGSVLAAMAGLATLAGVTGAMHLDGVGDTADGLASRKGPTESLALMKKSDIGPMAVATIVLVLLLQAAALASPALLAASRVPGTHGANGWAGLDWVLVATLVALPAVGRVAATNATVQGIPGATAKGFGALFTGITSRTAATVDALLVWALTAGLAWLAGGTGVACVAMVASMASWLVAARWQHHLLRRLGGLTGDTFGSLVEVCQTTFVMLVALGCGLVG